MIKLIEKDMQYNKNTTYFNSQEKESWRLMEQFVIKNMQAGAFVTDAGIKTRPMNKNETTPDRIQKLFDNIAYKKGKTTFHYTQYCLPI